jgi:hypothetical protein
MTTISEVSDEGAVRVLAVAGVRGRMVMVKIPPTVT